MLDLNGVWFGEWHSSSALRWGWRCLSGWSTSADVFADFLMNSRVANLSFCRVVDEEMAFFINIRE